MAQNEPTPNRGSLELSDDRARAVDEAGRRAGAALRSPAPADGAAAIRGRAHRRRVLRAGAATAMVGVLLAGVMALSSRDGSGDVQPADTPTDTVPETGPTASAATPEPTTKSTTPDSATAPSTIETTSTTNPRVPTASLEVVEAGTLDGYLPRFSTDGSLLATYVGEYNDVSRDFTGDVRIHDSATLTQVRELPCPTSLESLPASDGTGPGLDDVWDVEAATRWDAEAFTVLTSVIRPLLCGVTVSADGTRAVTDADVQGGPGGSLLWDVSDGSLLAVIPGRFEGFNTDGSRLFTTNGASLSMFDSSTGAVVRTIADDAAARNVLSPDGSRLIRWRTTTNSDGTAVEATIHDMRTLTTIATVSMGSPHGTVGIEDPVFDGTSDRVAALDASGATIWDASTGGHFRHVDSKLAVNGRHVVFSPGGAMIALRNGSHITIFDSSTGAQLADLELDADMFFSDVSFSADGVSLAAEVGELTRVWSYRRTD